MTPATDIARVKLNMEKMLASGAPLAEIERYAAAEGVTPEDARASSAASAGPSAQFLDTKAPRPDPSFWDYVKAVGGGANQFLEGVISLPAMALNEGAEQLLSGGPVGQAVRYWTGDKRKDVVPDLPLPKLSVLGIPIVPPRLDTPGLRLANRIGSFAPATMLGGPIGWGRNIGASIGAATGGQALEEGGANPAWQALGEMVMGAVHPMDALRVLSKVSVITPVVNAAWKGGRWAAGLRPSSADRDIAKSRVGQRLMTEITNKGRANIEEAMKVQEGIPGVRFTLGQASDVPSVKRLEEHFGSTSTGSDLNELAGIQDQTRVAITRAFEKGAPMGEVDDLVAEANRRLVEVDQNIAALVARVESSEPLIPSTDRSGGGQNVRAIVNKTKADLQDEYVEMRKHVGNEEVSLDDLQSDVRQILLGITETLRPQAARGVLGRLGRETPTGGKWFGGPPMSLSKFFRNRGGLKEGVFHGELAVRGIPIDRDGVINLEDATRIAFEQGYYEIQPSIDQLLDDLALDLSGRRRRYTTDVEEGLAARIGESGAAPPPEPMLASDLIDVDRELNRLIRAYDAPSPSRDLVYGRALYGAKQAVRARIEALSPEAQRAYEDAQMFYRDNVAPIFSQPGASRAVLRRQSGGYTTPDERVVGAYFLSNDGTPGALKSARQFHDATRDSTSAMADLRAYVLDDVSRAAVRDGVVDKKLLEAWRRNHSEALSEFPEIAGELSDMQRTVDAIASRRMQLAKRREAVENGILAGLVKKPLGDVIREAIKNPKAMMALVATARRSPEAQAALARAVWDALGPDVFENPARLLAILNKHSATLPLTSAHKDSLRRLAQAVQIQARTRPVEGRSIPMEGKVSEAVRGATGMSVTSIINTIYQGFFVRMISMRAAALRIGGAFLNAQAARETQALWRAALLNPDVARDLMNFVLAPKPATAATLRPYLLASGVNYLVGDGESAGSVKPFLRGGSPGSVTLPNKSSPIVIR